MFHEWGFTYKNKNEGLIGKCSIACFEEHSILTGCFLKNRKIMREMISPDSAGHSVSFDYHLMIDGFVRAPWVNCPPDPFWSLRVHSHQVLDLNLSPLSRGGSMCFSHSQTGPKAAVPMWSGVIISAGVNYFQYRLFCSLQEQWQW